MADKRCFVQFPHPGGEHTPDGDGKISRTPGASVGDAADAGAWRASA